MKLQDAFGIAGHEGGTLINSGRVVRGIRLGCDRAEQAYSESTVSQSKDFGRPMETIRSGQFDRCRPQRP